MCLLSHYVLNFKMSKGADRVFLVSRCPLGSQPCAFCIKAQRTSIYRNIALNLFWEAWQLFKSRWVEIRRVRIVWNSKGNQVSDSDSENLPDVSSIVFYFLDPSNPEYCQFLIDCSTIPRIISASQTYGVSYIHNHLFNITRTWIYTLHKERLKILGRWNIV